MQAQDRGGITGQSIFDFIDPDDADAVRARLASILEGKALPDRGMGSFVRSDGERIISETTGTLIGFDGEPAVLVILRDVTARVRAEEALRQSEERYRSLAEISPDAILVHQDGRIVYANPAALRLVGTTRYTDIAGKPLMDFIHPELRDLVISNIQSDFQGEHTLTAEVRMLRLDGQSVIVEGSGVLTTHEGRPAIQVAIRDITERRQAEEKIRQSEQKYRTVFETSGTATGTY